MRDTRRTPRALKAFSDRAVAHLSLVVNLTNEREVLHLTAAAAASLVCVIDTTKRLKIYPNSCQYHIDAQRILRAGNKEFLIKKCICLK